MIRSLKSITYPLLIILAIIIFAAPAFAGSNLSVSKAREFDPVAQMNQLDKKELNSSPMVSPSRADVDGHLIIYVVEPTGRWLDNGLTFPPMAPKPFGNAVIGYAYAQDVYLGESFDLTFDWDAAAAGFGDITEGNTRVIAAMFKTDAVATHFVVPGYADLYFDAHYVLAAAGATSGNPGNSSSDGSYTHTVFLEEAASTW